MPDTEPSKNPNKEISTREDKSSSKRTSTEKQSLSIWRRMFRMLLVILIFFGLGSLLVIYALYIPAREQLSVLREGINKLTTTPDIELDAANKEIGRLASIEDQYNDSQTRFERLDIQNTITEIKLDVTNAKLALVTDNPDEAAQALTETAGKIDFLKERLPKTQLQNLENLEKRLALIIEEIGDEQFAAISDLEVMLDILHSIEQEEIE